MTTVIIGDVGNRYSIDTDNLRRPNRPTAGQLAGAGVELIDASHMFLACVQCGHSWSPNFGWNGRLPAGYWKCPNGCNEGAK